MKLGSAVGGWTETDFGKAVSTLCVTEAKEGLLALCPN